MERKDLEDFRRKIIQIQGIMVQVSTGKAEIATKDAEYRELYADLKADFARLREQGLTLPHRNGFASLGDFYGYWSLKFPKWEQRREYVRGLYEDVEQAVTSILSGSHPHEDKAEGEISVTLTTEQPPLFAFTLDMLHPEIVRRCQHLFQAANYDEAILNAFKVAEEKVRQAARMRPEDIGVSLMKDTFKPSSPRLVYSTITAEQEGAMALFWGGIGCFKNPHSHRFVDITDPIQTFEILCFASILCRLIDGIESKKVT